MSSKQAAAQVRAALKAAGYGRADITVSLERDDIGSTIYVTLRRADIGRDAVEAMAAPFLISGENMVLDVGYDNGVLDAAEYHIAWMLGAGVTRFGTLQVSGSQLLDETGAYLDHIAREYGTLYAAAPIARALAVRGQLAGVLAGEAPRP